VALSFGLALRLNSSRAALKALGQEIGALHLQLKIIIKLKSDDFILTQ